MCRLYWKYLCLHQSSDSTHDGSAVQVCIYRTVAGESQNDRSVIQRVLHGQVQLVYITPENIMDNPMYRNMLLSNIYREKLVDEAHCV